MVAATLSGELAYRRSPDQDAARPVRHPVIVVGAGPVGLSAAIDLAQRGVPTVLLDEDHTLANGSRAICFAKRTLEVFDRLGCGAPMVDKGVSWHTGKVFFQDALVYQFDLQEGGGQKRPAFINLQQYYAEAFLIERARALPLLDIRWQNRVVGVEPRDDGVVVDIDTPEGRYRLHGGYLLAADGSRSPLRAMLGLAAAGHTFRDRFLIADVRMRAGFPAERWFWFDPPFHPNQSALLHRQPDDVWRIDFQLGWDADPDVEREPERVARRVRAMLGPAVEFELEWVSIYTFSCVRMERFRHGAVFFLGDAAHGVSPFGARGANGGVQDADNLAWKLAAVLKGWAGAALLDSYDAERIPATDENLLHSTRSTDFITPKSPVSRLFRDAVLKLARHHEFARRLVNSGRLSTPTVLAGSPLNTPDTAPFASELVPGAPCLDAPVTEGGQPAWLLDTFGQGFTVLCTPAGHAFEPPGLGTAGGGPEVEWLCVAPAGALAPASGVGRRWIGDPEGLVARRYDLAPGTTYLIRPDQHVAARWRSPEPAALRRALARALARAEGNET